MPYGCAIKDYSSGLCQPPPAHYKPYARSTAVSPSARNVAIGTCSCLVLSGCPHAWPSLSPFRASLLTEKGSGKRGKAVGEKGMKGGRSAWLSWVQWARHEGPWHKAAL